MASSIDQEATSVSDNVIRAAQTFDLDQHHEKIYDNPNDLIEAGFPGDFLLPIVKVFKSSVSYKYFRRGEIVNEMAAFAGMA